MDIQINLTISADPALMALLQSLTGKAPEPVKKTKAAKESEVIPASNGVAKAEPEPAKVEVAAETTHTIESLRALAVPKSRAGKKDEIKAWLNEAGYSEGLSALQPKDFGGFHDFITKL